MYKITQFSERLKELMFERDLNAPALAKQTGIERSTINGLERGAHFPSIKVCSVLLITNRTKLLSSHSNLLGKFFDRC